MIIGSLISSMSTFLDQRLRFGERLVDRGVERIEVGREHVQRAEQVGR
jgi:hypothetical protein